MSLEKNNKYEKYKDLPDIENKVEGKKVNGGLVFICSTLILSMFLTSSLSVNSNGKEFDYTSEEIKGYATENMTTLDEFLTSENFYKVENHIPMQKENIPKSLREQLFITPPPYMQSEEEKKSIYSLFDEYCGYYGLDTAKVYALALHLTEGFTNEQFLDGFIIGNTKFYQTSQTYPTLEAGIIAFIRDVSLEPENFNISLNDFSTGVYEKCTSYECLVGEVSKYCTLDRSTILAIMYLETGRFTSTAFENYNNPAGIMLSTGLKRFESKEQGIIEAIYNLYMNYYKDDTNKDLYEVGLKYCPPGGDNGTDENYMWPKLVGEIKSEIEENPSIFIESKEKTY
ncbi:MAG: glucosaminidase domain-containing protein [Bacilli bacterium]|nr:glucosaminidase domain-containing protein [Bacilli bacterium]